jgi:hypothetical protein
MRDVEEIPQLIRAGEEAAEARVPYIRRTLESFHSVRNRTKRRLRIRVVRSLRTSVSDLPAY